RTGESAQISFYYLFLYADQRALRSFPTRRSSDLISRERRGAVHEPQHDAAFLVRADVGPYAGFGGDQPLQIVGKPGGLYAVSQIAGEQHDVTDLPSLEQGFRRAVHRSAGDTDHKQLSDGLPQR